MEELKVPECVRIANRREHAAEVALLRFHAIFLPEPSDSKMIAGGHHVLEEVAQVILSSFTSEQQIVVLSKSPTVNGHT